MTKWQEHKKAIEKKVKLPEENVEYTFIFPGGKYITYVFCGLNEKGRLILYNVKQKTFSTMSPGWFAALTGKRKQLVSKRPVGELPKDDKPNDKQGFKIQWREETYEERSIRELRELSPALALSIHSALGYPPAELADNLESVLRDKEGVIYSEAFVGRCFCDLMRAQGILHEQKNRMTL